MVRSRVPVEVTYKPYLCSLMAFKHGVDSYPKTVEFSEQQRLSITPNDIERWLKKIAYGKPNPGPNDHPTEARSTHLEQAKKAVSYFMPNQHPWVVEHGSGNPTRNKIVNKVIKDVRQAEVRRLGRASNAKRDLTRPEFRMTLRILEDAHGLVNFDKTAKYPCMLKKQFHIIGRTDDIANIETNDLRSHPLFSDFALSMKVSWSKNVMDERECPPQLLIGAMDDDFCVLMADAAYLECTLAGRQHKKYLFEEWDDDAAPDRLNARYARVLSKLWKNPEFRRLSAQTPGSLGTHSLRKFPATWCAQQGCSDPEIEIRGRWKGKKNGRVVNRYISVEQLPTDAKLAGLLAVGGPVKYKLKPDSHVTAEFMSEVVVPAITSHYSHDESNHIPSVLGPALLYAAHVPACKHMFTEAVRRRILDGYAAIKGDHPVDYNPVEKVPIHIFRVENQVMIEELQGNNPDNSNANAQQLVGVAAAVGQRQDMQSAMLQIHRLHQDQAQLQQRMEVNVFMCLMETMYLHMLTCFVSIL